MAAPNHPGERFTRIFSTFMVFCVMVWLWGLGLFMLWPWQKGGQWLPDFPLVATCADGNACAVPQGQLVEAFASNKILSLNPPEKSGETAYEMIAVRWKPHANGIELKASAWNFQTTVRYRVEDKTPVLLEYQEISGKVFLIALIGALVSTALLYLRKRSA